MINSAQPTNPFERWVTLRLTRPTLLLRALLHAAVELVRLRQAMGETAGVGAVAAPVRQFLPGHTLLAPGGILPAEPGLGIEHGNVGKRAAGIFLQPNAAAARHLRHLIEREQHHLVVAA